MSALPAWCGSLKEHLNQAMKDNKDSISYCLSTLAPDGPSARFVVHRGFVNERRSSEDPSWSSNAAKSSDGTPLEGAFLLSTTDVRAPKSIDIHDRKSTEIAWWLEPTKHQYRIRGQSWIVPRPDHPYIKDFPGDKFAPSGYEGQFDWEAERIRIYRKLSPALRASFVRPVPGQSLSTGVDPPSAYPAELPTDLEAKDDEKKAIQQALQNFALIVIDPHSIDVCDLGSQPNTRHKWTRGSDGSWKQDEVVP